MGMRSCATFSVCGLLWPVFRDLSHTLSHSLCLACRCTSVCLLTSKAMISCCLKHRREAIDVEVLSQMTQEQLQSLVCIFNRVCVREREKEREGERERESVCECKEMHGECVYTCVCVCSHATAQSRGHRQFLVCVCFCTCVCARSRLTASSYLSTEGSAGLSMSFLLLTTRDALACAQTYTHTQGHPQDKL